MGRHFFLAAIACAALNASVGAAAAQVLAEPVDPDHFVENFDTSVAVSGTALVGLSLGAYPGALDMTNILLAAPPGGTTRLCVRTTTRDGRFTASNPYVLRQAVDAAVKLAPLTRQYGAELSGYLPSEIAIRAFVGAGESCSPKDAIHLPQLQPLGGADRLTVLVNGSSRSGSAKLVGSDGAAVSEAACQRPPSGALIAFDQVCELDRSGAEEAGVYSLVVDLDDGFGVESFTAQVFLPALP